MENIEIDTTNELSNDNFGHCQNLPTQETATTLDELQGKVNIADLPDIIQGAVTPLDELQAKVKLAKTAAETACNAAKNLVNFENHEFLGIKWKTGNEKEKIEQIQDVIKETTDALLSNTNAQVKILEFEQKLAAASQYLFYLGTYNIAANEAMIENLKNYIDDEKKYDSNGNYVSETVKKRFSEVVQRLKKQQDILKRQEAVKIRLQEIDKILSNKISKEYVDQKLDEINNNLNDKVSNEDIEQKLDEINNNLNDKVSNEDIEQKINEINNGLNDKANISVIESIKRKSTIWNIISTVIAIIAIVIAILF